MSETATATAPIHGERVLQRMVMPLEADHDILPLYVESAITAAPAEVQDRVGAESAPKTGESNYPIASAALSGAQGAAVSSATTVTSRHSMLVEDGDILSLGTYFNAFPASYWQRWTNLRAVTLRLSVSGTGAVVVQRSTSKGHIIRVESRKLEGSTPETIEFELPLTNFMDGGWYWFDLAADGSDLNVLSGEWVADTDRTTPGTFSIGITTMNRPTFCVDQLVSLAQQDSVLEILDEIFVIDQGTQKVVDEERYSDVAARLGDKLRVIEQPNLGGSGGFSRAMDETATKGVSTYCLLLDDDVVCEPEGILRAATFADLARTSTIVGGQMLSLYDRCVLHAFGEAVKEYRWFWGPAPGTYHGMDFGRRSMRSTPWLHRRIDVDYNGWWMCLIPTDVIRKIGLASPMFIKWDDAEYGLRARAAGHPTVTLPGVTVWHVPWHEKDDTLDWQAYFHRRNRIFAALLHSPYEHGGRLIWESFQTQVRHLLTMQYSAAEMGLLAVEDLLEGPHRMHRDVSYRVHEMRELRKRFVDSQLSDDIEQFPPARRKKPPRRGQSPMAPRGKLGLIRSAGFGAIRQITPVRRSSRSNPELAVPHMYLNWWRLAQVDSALVSGADGATVSWYQRDTDRFRDLMQRSIALHVKLYQQWSKLTETYRSALPEVSSPEVWRRTIETYDRG